MNTVQLKYRRNKHFVEMKELGYIFGSLGRLYGLERQAHAFAEKLCNEDISESTQERRIALLESKAAELFGGELPKGFFINLDPRGYALKLDDTQFSRDPRDPNHMPISYTDMGGYGIFAPDFE